MARPTGGYVAQVWPKGEAAHGALTLRGRTVADLCKAIRHYVPIQRPAWVGKDLWVASFASPRRSWQLPAGADRLKRLR